MRTVSAPPRVQPMRADFLAEVVGPWTGDVVETMIALHAMAESDYDRSARHVLTRPKQRASSSWVWSQHANGHRLHLLAYYATGMRRWEYVLELTRHLSTEEVVSSAGAPAPASARRGRAVLPSVTVWERDIMVAKAAAMLNYALTLPNPTTNATGSPSRASLVARS